MALYQIELMVQKAQAALAEVERFIPARATVQTSGYTMEQEEDYGRMKQNSNSATARCASLSVSQKRRRRRALCRQQAAGGWQAPEQRWQAPGAPYVDTILARAAARRQHSRHEECGGDSCGYWRCNDDAGWRSSWHSSKEPSWWQQQQVQQQAASGVAPPQQRPASAATAAQRCDATAPWQDGDGQQQRPSDSCHGLVAPHAGKAGAAAWQQQQQTQEVQRILQTATDMLAWVARQPVNTPPPRGAEPQLQGEMQGDALANHDPWANARWIPSRAQARRRDDAQGSSDPWASWKPVVNAASESRRPFGSAWASADSVKDRGSGSSAQRGNVPAGIRKALSRGEGKPTTTRLSRVSNEATQKDRGVEGKPKQPKWNESSAIRACGNGGREAVNAVSAMCSGAKQEGSVQEQERTGKMGDQSKRHERCYDGKDDESQKCENGKPDGKDRTCAATPTRKGRRVKQTWTPKLGMVSEAHVGREGAEGSGNASRRALESSAADTAEQRQQQCQDEDAQPAHGHSVAVEQGVDIAADLMSSGVRTTATSQAPNAEQQRAARAAEREAAQAYVQEEPSSEMTHTEESSVDEQRRARDAAREDAATKARRQSGEQERLQREAVAAQRKEEQERLLHETAAAEAHRRGGEQERLPREATAAVEASTGLSYRTDRENGSARAPADTAARTERAADEQATHETSVPRALSDSADRGATASDAATTSGSLRCAIDVLKHSSENRIGEALEMLGNTDSISPVDRTWIAGLTVNDPAEANTVLAMALSKILEGVEQSDAGKSMPKVRTDVPAADAALSRKERGRAARATGARAAPPVNFGGGSPDSGDSEPITVSLSLSSRKDAEAKEADDAEAAAAAAKKIRETEIAKKKAAEAEVQHEQELKEQREARAAEATAAAELKRRQGAETRRAAETKAVATAKTHGQQCQPCNGTGKVWFRQCSACRGTGARDSDARAEASVCRSYGSAREDAERAAKSEPGDEKVAVTATAAKKAKKARAAEAKAAAEAKNSEQGSCPAHRSGGSARLDKGWKAYCAHQGMALRRISRASSDEHFARVATVSMSASVDVAQARILREALDGGDDAFEKKARSIAESARDKKDLDELMELWAKRAGDRSSQELERQDGEAAQRGRDDAEPIQVLGVHHAEDADEAAGAGCAAAIRR